jgi:hypothetical protein
MRKFKKIYKIACFIGGKALFAALLFFTPLNASAEPKNIFCISLPKAGTHLLMKCLSLFDETRFRFNYKQSLKPSPKKIKLLNKINSKKPPHHYKGRYYFIAQTTVPEHIVGLLEKSCLTCDHWPYTKAAEAYFNEKTKANFLMIRDPRAILTSMAFMVKDGFRNGEHANPQDLMWDFINGKKKHFIQWGVEVNGTYPLLWEKGVVEFYKLYLPWMKSKKFYTVRFEDLVGRNGGGSDEVQAQTIHAMANHIGIALSPDKFASIKNELFGNSSTFREGSIDGWKKHFTPAMKDAFKKVPGANQLLIELGYEKDSNW